MRVFGLILIILSAIPVFGIDYCPQLFLRPGKELSVSHVENGPGKNGQSTSSKLVLKSKTGEQVLELIAPIGETILFSDSVRNSSISPGGKYIVVHTNKAARVYSLPSKELIVDFNYYPNNGKELPFFKWSPSGESLLLVKDNGGWQPGTSGELNLVVANFKTGTIVDLAALVAMGLDSLSMNWRVKDVLWNEGASEVALYLSKNGLTGKINKVFVYNFETGVSIRKYKESKASYNNWESIQSRANQFGI